MFHTCYADRRSVESSGDGIILETHHLGLDTGPALPARSTPLGGLRETAETRAQLEVMRVPRQPQLRRTGVDQDLGLDLFD